jgi:hypothetical protein
MIYFRGTDDKLWAANPDGSNGFNVGGYKTNSTPVAFGQYVYFQGTDDKLWRINLDGSGGINLGGYKTSSPPCVTATYLFFQGTDNKLWRINLDGSGGLNIGGYKTASSPTVGGPHVFFRGTDNKLWRINMDGTGGIDLGLYQTESTPFVANGFVYFQGTDNKLWRINVDGTQGINLGGYKTNSTPIVTNQFVYFEGTDNKLWRINLDGSAGVNLGGYKTKSSPGVDTTMNFIYFQGTDDKLWRINIDGTHGVNIGNFKTASEPFVVQPANQPQSGTIRLPYVILTLVYAPPGTNGGKSASSVDYGNGSATGSTNSISNSFKNTASVTAGISVAGFDASSTFTLTNQQTDTASIEIKKTTSYDIIVNGPGADGINHDEDLFYLWLNPLMTLTVDANNNLNWQLAPDGPTMIVEAVYTGWLREPSTMPPGVKSVLGELTASDFATILATNPFALGATAIDPNRYLPTAQSFPYIPPRNLGDPVQITKYNQTNTVTNTATSAASVTYGLQFKAGFGSGILKGTGVSDTLEWTSTSSTATTSANTPSASVSIGGPAFGFADPVADVLVYWDTVYNSFLFAFTTDPPGFTASLSDKSGASLAHQPVSLSAGSHTFTTYTDSKGEARFYNVPAGPAKLNVLQESYNVTAGRGLAPVNLQIGQAITVPEPVRGVTTLA